MLFRVVVSSGRVAALGVEVLLELLLNNGFRHRNLDELEELLQDLVAGLDALLDELVLGGSLRQVGAQLIDGVEFAGQLGEVIIGVRELALLHCLHDDGYLCSLAGVLTTGEGGLKGRGFLRAQAGDCFVHALEHGAGTNLVGDVGSGIHFLAVDLRSQVKGEEVTVSRRTVHFLQGAETAAKFVECLHNVLIGRFGSLNCYLQAGVFGKLDLRTDVQFDGEEKLAVLRGRIRNLSDLNLGPAQGTDLRLLNGALVKTVQPIVDRGLDDVTAADALVDQLVGDLALAETRNLHLACDGLVGSFDVRLEFLERDLHVELHSRGSEVFDSALHSLVLLNDRDRFCTGYTDPAKDRFCTA